jgi:cardiolipin synthase A/B
LDFWESVQHYWQEITAWITVVDFFITVITIAWILALKKEPTSALAWCLLAIFLPLVGPLVFFFFGYQHVHRPLKRKRRHQKQFRSRDPASVRGLPRTAESTGPEAPWESMARLAQRVEAFPLTQGNQVDFYHEGVAALEAKLKAIQAAQHHIHLEYFIIQPDECGRSVIDELARKAREGVQVRLLYDAMGSHRLGRRHLRPLLAAGGQVAAFLPFRLLRRRLQVNLRNHRKILVVDGQVAFTGGLNLGDEYLCKVARFGFWRDTDLRVEGPAVADLQRVFIEDWDFASGEHLRGDAYYPVPARKGRLPVQVISSGPDQDFKAIREVYFAAILRAQKRLWIASPYFVPDAALMDALCLAGYQGVDVRLLGQYRPDKWIPYFAARYYWGDVLEAGVKVYQYTRGMMHSKVILVDGQWASVGSANLDNRSMHLNFELNCLIYSPEATAELERAFVQDLQEAIQLDREVFARRPFPGRVIENACRLLSPVL